MIRASGQQPQQFVFFASDFAVPGSGTALEVANALNARLNGVTADVVGRNAVRLNTTQVGPAATLSLDVRYSTAARGLGFDARTRRPWGMPAMRWTGSLPRLRPPAPTGTAANPIYHADLHTLVDSERTGVALLGHARCRRLADCQYTAQCGHVVSTGDTGRGTVR